MSASEGEEESSPGSGSCDGGDPGSDGQWPVTDEWLTVMLTSYHESLNSKHVHPESGAKSELIIRILDFAVSPGFDAGESVLSDILAVKVDYLISNERPDQTRQMNCIIKLLPHDPFSRFFVTEAQFDLREIKFYTTVVPELEKLQNNYKKEGGPMEILPIPKCYYARYRPGRNNPDHSPTLSESVLVLENLKSQGYSSADFSRGLTLIQAGAALKAIARLHALALALKIHEGKPLQERYPFLFQTARATDSYQQLVERGLPQLARFLESRPGFELILTQLDSLRPITKELIAALLKPQEPMALITHTDFWCNNLLFREDESEGCICAILDWQMATYSRPTNDIALLLVSSLSGNLRRSHTSELLDKYWKELLKACMTLGIAIETDLHYSRAKLGEDYKKSQLLALLLCIGSIDVALGDPRTEQRLLDVLHDLNEEGILNSELPN